MIAGTDQGHIDPQHRRNRLTEHERLKRRYVVALCSRWNHGSRIGAVLKHLRAINARSISSGILVGAPTAARSAFEALPERLRSARLLKWPSPGE